MEKELPPVIDLFCGAGGMSEGFKQAGFPIASGFDYDSKSIETYDFNFNKKGHCYDLSKIKGEKIRELSNLKRRDECIVIAGPPCQGFSSVNGRKESSFDKNHFVIRTAELIAEINPFYFVVENVLQMKNLNEGKYFNKFVDIVQKNGYQIKYQILDASKYGVPQKRRRIFVIGTSKSNGIEFPEANNKVVTVKEAISDLPNINWKEEGKDPTNYKTEPLTQYQRIMRSNYTGKVHNHIITLNGAEVIERYKKIKPGESYIDAVKRMNGKIISVNYSNVYRKFKGNKPAPTIANPRKSMYIHYSQTRGLSIREVARLQSFPDDFIFQSTKSYQQQQVANAVPPLLAKKIGLTIKDNV